MLCLESKGRGEAEDYDNAADDDDHKSDHIGSTLLLKVLATCGEDKTIRLWGREGDQWTCKTVLTEGHTR